jgi:hypothetical protein
VEKTHAATVGRSVGRSVGWLAAGWLAGWLAVVLLLICKNVHGRPWLVGIFMKPSVNRDNNYCHYYVIPTKSRLRNYYAILSSGGRIWCVGALLVISAAADDSCVFCVFLLSQ